MEFGVLLTVLECGGIEADIRKYISKQKAHTYCEHFLTGLTFEKICDYMLLNLHNLKKGGKGVLIADWK